MSNQLERIRDGRSRLVLDHPFFGALILRLRLVESTGQTDTMATNGQSLFYNPAYVATLTDGQLVTVLAHEVLHLALLHHTRRDNREQERWNIAADYAINPILADARFEMSDDWLLDPAYAGMSAEQIYDELPPPPEGCCDTGGGGGGDGSSESAPANMPGAVLDAPEPTSETEWQVATKQAVQAAKMMAGQLPASLARAVAEALRPRVDWRSLLRRFVQQCAAADYSWRMPNRRYIASGLYMPELRSETLPPIAIAIDTSASIDETQLAEFRAEVQSVVEECAPERTYVMYCDATVQHVDVFARDEPIEMNAKGGGGTDFRPVFDYIDAEQMMPACVIYLTDGEGKYPATPSDYPTLWAMTSSIVAPWGETVRIEQ